MTEQHDCLVLEPLVDRLLAAAALPVQEERKRLWADHQALRRTGPTPVCVYYEGMPAPLWASILGPDVPRCRGALGRAMEVEIRKILWMADNVPDDHIVWPSVVVDAVRAQCEDWGVPLVWEGSHAGVNDPLEARRIVPPLADGIDLGRLKFTDLEVDVEASRRKLDAARLLLGGRLTVHLKWPDLGHSPFDIAARLCGLENLLIWCAESPELVAELMRFLSRSHREHHERRELEGRINLHREGEYARVGFRVHAWRPGAGASPGLRDEWAYVSAQTSSGLGPAQFVDLVEPTSVELAAPFARGTVYFHGCECLDQKLDSIARIPNLRRLHVSPWSSLPTARSRFGDTVVYEVHSNPSEVFFAATTADIRRGVDRLVAQGEGCGMDLNLSDIHSVNGRPELLGVWAAEAREAVEGRVRV